MNNLYLLQESTMEVYEMSQSARKVWREGFVPLLSLNSLTALRKGLVENDSRLIQGYTTLPTPHPSIEDWPVEAGCAIGYCGWKGEGLETVGEVEEFFSRLMYECDCLLGEPAACRWFLNWFDYSTNGGGGEQCTRSQVFNALLVEVNLAIAQKIKDIKVE